MGGTLTQRRRVGEEILRDVKPCCMGRAEDGTIRGSPGKLRASSRGNT